MVAGIHALATKQDVDGRAFASPKRLRPRRRDQPGPDGCASGRPGVTTLPRWPADHPSSSFEELDEAIVDVVRHLLRDVVAARHGIGVYDVGGVFLPDLGELPGPFRRLA